MNEEENQEAQTQVILQSFKMNNFKSSKQRFRKKYVTWIYHQILLISLWKTCAMFKVKWALMQGQILLHNTLEATLTMRRWWNVVTL